MNECELYEVITEEGNVIALCSILSSLMYCMCCSYLMGEEGYCLTSLQTAIAYGSRINERMDNQKNEQAGS